MNKPPISFLQRIPRSARARFDHAVLLARRRYHRCVLPALLGENPPEGSERWALFAHNTGGLVENLADALIAQRLMALGWHCKFIYQGLWFDDIGSDNHYLDGALAHGRRPSECSLVSPSEEPARWDIDMSSGRIGAFGIDLSEIVLTTIKNVTPVRTDSLNAPELQPWVNSIIDSAKAALEVARRIETAAHDGKTIRIIGHETKFVPNGIITAYLTQSTEKDHISIYNVGSTYKTFYEYNVGHKKKVRKQVDVALSKVTSLEVISQITIPRTEFDQWYDSLPKEEVARITERIEAIIKSRGVRDKIKATRNDGIHQRIDQARSNGTPVYCLFSSTTNDNVPFEGSSTFPTMTDWIRETVRAFRDIDGLLLVKPHLAEVVIRDRIAHRNISLADMMTEWNLGDNVIILPPEQFLLSEMTAFIDGGLVWRSTAYLELVMAGIPSLFGATRSNFSEPMGIVPPKSLDDYITSIRTLPHSQPGSDDRNRAAAIIYYMQFVRPVPLEMAYEPPKWLARENSIVSPLVFAKNRLFGTGGLESVADAISQNLSGPRTSSTG